SVEDGEDGIGGEWLYQYERDYMVMNGREVFKFAVRQMPESSVNVVETIAYNKDDVDYLILHHAHIRIMEAARERLGIHEDKMATTINRYGNTSYASETMAV